MIVREEHQMMVLAVIAVILVASIGPLEGDRTVFGNYFYWTLRISIQGLLFFGVRATVEKLAGEQIRPLVVFLIAMVGSHVPYVLSVTAIDIVLGYPELGIDEATAQASRLRELLLEMGYLADNHLALCLLLSTPRWFGSSPPEPEQEEMEVPEVAPDPISLPVQSFLASLQPVLAGKVLWVEAQEHYVKITTTEESRMILARFSDVVRELPGDEGMQVHRSHWIATAAVEEAKQDGQSLRLLLNTGDLVPVSRSYRQDVKRTLGIGRRR